MQVGCPRVRQLVIKRACLWERKLARGGEWEETVRGFKARVCPGQKGLCAEHLRSGDGQTYHRVPCSLPSPCLFLF